MTLEIQENGKYYMFKNVHWVQKRRGYLTINYTGEDGEVHEEIGPIPEYIRVMDCE